MPRAKISQLPQRLHPGQVVALVAPAFQFDAKLFAQGRKFLEDKFGVKTIWREDASKGQAYFAGSDRRRTDELYQWLTDPNVSAVLAIRGGYGCARIYPDLIKELRKRKNLKPKIVAGYSDLTILLNGLHQDLGWTTFHAPVIVGRPFREPVPVETSTFQKTLFTNKPLGPVTDSSMTTLSPGRARGKLVGGCLSILLSTLGTSYEIETDNKILFMEDVDERPYRLDRMLTQFIHAKKLDRVRGIVFGQMAHCEPLSESRDPSRTSAVAAIRLALEPLLKRRKIPVVFDFPAGHGNPQITFPIGCEVELRAERGAAEVEFLMSGVK